MSAPRSGRTTTQTDALNKDVTVDTDGKNASVNETDTTNSNTTENTPKQASDDDGYVKRYHLVEFNNEGMSPDVYGYETRAEAWANKRAYQNESNSFILVVEKKGSK